MPERRTGGTRNLHISWATWIRENTVIAGFLGAGLVAIVSWAGVGISGYFAKEWHGPTSIQQVIKSIAKTQAQVDRTEAGLARISDDALLKQWREELARMRKASHTPDTVPPDWFTENEWNNWIFVQEEAASILAARRAKNIQKGVVIDHAGHAHAR